MASRPDIAISSNAASARITLVEKSHYVVMLGNFLFKNLNFAGRSNVYNGFELLDNAAPMHSMKSLRRVEFLKFIFTGLIYRLQPNETKAVSERKIITYNGLGNTPV